MCGAFPPETVLKFRALKKPAQLAVINSLEKVSWLIDNPGKDDRDDTVIRSS